MHTRKLKPKKVFIILIACIEFYLFLLQIFYFFLAIVKIRGSFLLKILNSAYCQQVWFSILLVKSIDFLLWNVATWKQLIKNLLSSLFSRDGVHLGIYIGKLSLNQSFSKEFLDCTLLQRMKGVKTSWNIGKYWFLIFNLIRFLWLFLSKSR